MSLLPLGGSGSPRSPQGFLDIALEGKGWSPDSNPHVPHRNNRMGPHYILAGIKVCLLNFVWHHPGREFESFITTRQRWDSTLTPWLCRIPTPYLKKYLESRLWTDLSFRRPSFHIRLFWSINNWQIPVNDSFLVLRQPRLPLHLHSFLRWFHQIPCL